MECDHDFHLLSNRCTKCGLAKRDYVSGFSWSHFIGEAIGEDVEAWWSLDPCQAQEDEYDISLDSSLAFIKFTRDGQDYWLMVGKL